MAETSVAETRLTDATLPGITLNGAARAHTRGETVTDLVGEATGRRIAPDGQAADGKRLGVAVAEIEREKITALAEMKDKMADLTIQAASKVVEKSLSKSEHEKFIEDFIAGVGSLNEN